jgi:hypothetical protein
MEDSARSHGTESTPVFVSHSETAEVTMSDKMFVGKDADAKAVVGVERVESGWADMRTRASPPTEF